MTVLMLAGCGNEGTAEPADAHKTGSMQLDYATQFSVDYYDDDVCFIKVEDGLEYWLVPDEYDMPSWLTDEMIGDRTVISRPAKSLLLFQSTGSRSNRPG